MPSEYELLPAIELADGDSLSREDETRKLAMGKHLSNLWTWLPVGLSILCTVANVGIWWKSGAPERITHTSLVRPSTYMGLDKLQPLPEDERLMHLTNFPIVMTQVSQTQPSLVSPDDSTRRLTTVGTVSPDVRRFAVSDKLSTIAQFRTVDYGFENCSLQFSLQLPPGTDGSDVGNNASKSAVDVWILDAPTQLDVTRLSWDQRPRRRQLLESWHMSWGSSETSERSFACPWNSMQSFEFACSKNEECLLDFWQDPKKPHLGVTIVQSSSLV